jgi:tetratricopeptide (TPR) repeat protein
MPTARSCATLVAFVFLSLVWIVSSSAPASASTLAEAEALFEAEKYDEAKALFKKLSKETKDDSTPFYYLGRIARVEEKTDDAIDYFQKAIEIEESSDYYVWLGDTYVQKIDEVNFLKKKGIAGKIRDAFLRAVELDPESVDARASLAGFYMEAPGFAGGSKDKAREHIEVLKTLDPLEGADSAAQLYQKEEEYDLAEKEFMALCDGTAEDAPVYYRVGFMYQSAKMWDDSVRNFEKALEMDPDYGNAL